MDRNQMAQLTAHTEVKSEKIRILFDAGAQRSEIAKFIDISYQHVQNVLKRSGKLTTSYLPSEKITNGTGDLSTITLLKGGLIELPGDYLRGEGAGEGDALICRRERDGIHIMSRAAATQLLMQKALERMPEEAALLDVLIGNANRD